MSRAHPQVKKLRTLDELRTHLDAIGVALPLVDEVRADGALARPLVVALAGRERTIANRFAILPMEGWDGTTDGLPTELVRRRWGRFGASGAGLVWGGEAVAVDPVGRANPNQLTAHTDAHGEALGELRAHLVAAHEAAGGDPKSLVVGLQLTHSGRFCRPTAAGMAPLTAGPHPVLDRRLPPASAARAITDDELDALTEAFVAASVRAEAAGFDFVDVKACHGYLGHELLGAVERPGPYGGSFENRTRFLRQTIEGVRSAAPSLGIGVRFSMYDFVPFRPGPDGTGEPEPVDQPYRHGFGGDGTGLGIDLSEPKALLDLLGSLGVEMVCATAGSPYYVPHIQRPAWFPPSDGYQPPEDPLVGVARMLAVTAELRAHRPELVMVGSGYTYLQDWLAHVGEAVVAGGGADLVGLGRMVLSYPELPRDVLAGEGFDRRKVCRTFSDCTTAPRNGLVSGCFPIDDFYKQHPQRVELAAIKKAQRS